MAEETQTDMTQSTEPEVTRNEMDLDPSPELLDNPTLGAQNLPFLDELEAQERENYQAATEGREPMLIRRKNRQPGAENNQELDYIEQPKSASGNTNSSARKKTPSAG